MECQAKGRLFKRKDGTCLIYIPKDIAEDLMFPFPIPEGETSYIVKISFSLPIAASASKLPTDLIPAALMEPEKKLTIEEWKE